MQLITFFIGKERYAIDTNLIIEVVPLLDIRKLAFSEDYIAGVINYRGSTIPVIDMGCLLLKNPADRKVSTRIIIINYKVSAHECKSLGLITERATGIIQSSQEAMENIEDTLESTPFLGGLIYDDEGIVQVIDPCRAVKHSFEKALDCTGE